MKGFIRVVGEIERKSNYGNTSRRTTDLNPAEDYVAISDIMVITTIPNSETKLSAAFRSSIVECFSTSVDQRLHAQTCQHVCSCFTNGSLPEQFYPLIIVQMRTVKTREFIVYPDQKNRQLLMLGGETTTKTELLRQILQELQYGSPAGSGYGAARKRFYNEIEKE
jgi:hypothetical protein